MKLFLVQGPLLQRLPYPSFLAQVSNLAGFQEPGLLASPVLPFPLGEAAPALLQFTECVIGGIWGGECSGSEGSTGPTHIRMGKCHTTVSRHWIRLGPTVQKSHLYS